MLRQLSRLLGATALAATLCLTASAQEYSNGGTCAKGRGPATATPVEAFGVHPPGLDPADAHRFFRRWRHLWAPYYAPAAPVATSARWKPWCYFPLMPWYTPYYCGYCPKRLHNPPPRPYGCDGWGKGPMPDPNFAWPAGAPLNFGPYTSILRDDTVFWNMGGNGLVPYGTPRPPHPEQAGPDLVDMIQAARAQGGGAGCAPPLVDGPAPAPGDGAGPLVPPAEPAEAQKSSKNKPADKEEAAEEKPATPE